MLERLPGFTCRPAVERLPCGERGGAPVAIVVVVQHVIGAYSSGSAQDFHLIPFSSQVPKPLWNTRHQSYGHKDSESRAQCQACLNYSVKPNDRTSWIKTVNDFLITPSGVDALDITAIRLLVVGIDAAVVFDTLQNNIHPLLATIQQIIADLISDDEFDNLE